MVFRHTINKLCRVSSDDVTSRCRESTRTNKQLVWWLTQSLQCSPSCSRTCNAFSQSCLEGLSVARAVRCGPTQHGNTASTLTGALLNEETAGCSYKLAHAWSCSTRTSSSVLLLRLFPCCCVFSFRIERWSVEAESSLETWHIPKSTFAL